MASRPVVAASTAPPPLPIAVDAANWAVPDHTRADITIAGTAPNCGPATSPKLIPMAAVGSSRGSAARKPSGRKPNSPPEGVEFMTTVNQN